MLVIHNTLSVWVTRSRRGADTYRFRQVGWGWCTLQVGLAAMLDQWRLPFVGLPRPALFRLVFSLIALGPLGMAPK